jgi:hypothetical protein
MQSRKTLVPFPRPVDCLGLSEIFARSRENGWAVSRLDGLADDRTLNF